MRGVGAGHLGVEPDSSTACKAKVNSLQRLVPLVPKNGDAWHASYLNPSKKSSENHENHPRFHKKSKKHRQVFRHQPSLLGDNYTWHHVAITIPVMFGYINIPSHRVTTNCIALLVETHQKHPKTMSPVGELKHQNDPASPFDKSRSHLLRCRSFSYARRVGPKNKHMEWATRVEAVPRCSRNPLRHIQ